MPSDIRKLEQVQCSSMRENEIRLAKGRAVERLRSSKRNRGYVMR
jgi:hypothetical protein